MFSKNTNIPRSSALLLLSCSEQLTKPSKSRTSNPKVIQHRNCSLTALPCAQSSANKSTQSQTNQSPSNICLNPLHFELCCLAALEVAASASTSFFSLKILIAFQTRRRSFFMAVTYRPRTSQSASPPSPGSIKASRFASLRSEVPVLH